MDIVGRKPRSNRGLTHEKTQRKGPERSLRSCTNFDICCCDYCSDVLDWGEGMKQLTKKQAIEFFESNAWEKMSHEERATFQLKQDRLCMPFDKFHESIEVLLGRPVYTHEFGLNRDGLIQEAEGKAHSPTL